MGGARIIVPEGIAVEVAKLPIMSGHHVQLGAETPPPDAPLLRLRLLSIMGGVQVRRARRHGDADAPPLPPAS